jgi:hypothetical protein
MEVFFPWFRVKVQGLRASFDTLRDPDLRTGYAARIGLTEILPRILKVAVAAGIISGSIKWLVRDDEDEKDPVMPEVLRRVSPYKMALDDVIPIMMYDPRSGKYHYFNEFKSGKSIPAHYEVVSYRIPSSEEGREFGPLFYNLAATMLPGGEKVARPGETPVTAVGNWAMNSLLPQVSPAITTGKNLYEMIFTGKNPDDPFRGQPSANKVMFDAGGSERAQAIAGYAMNQLGFPGELAAIMAMNMGVLDERAANALKQRIPGDKTAWQEKAPLVKNLLSYDNYAQYRDEGAARKIEEQIRAKVRSIMSPEVQAIYNFYWKNYERQDKLDVTDKQRFVIASDFHNRFGKLTEPGSLYARTAHALTAKDASKESKKTARNDLDMASTPYVARWKLITDMAQ